MFAAMHGIDEASGAALGSATEVMRVAAGRAPPPAELRDKAKLCVAKLPELDAAPELCIPARRVTWMRPLKTAAGAFDALVCDTAQLAEAVLGGVPLGASMLSDHMTDNYERSLDALAPSAAQPKKTA